MCAQESTGMSMCTCMYVTPPQHEDRTFNKMCSIASASERDVLGESCLHYYVCINETKRTIIPLTVNYITSVI